MTDDEFQSYRNSDPETSKKAGRRDRTRHADKMLMALEVKGPLTAYDAMVVTELDYPGSSAWTRFSELRKKDYIEETGEERVGPTPPYYCQIYVK